MRQKALILLFMACTLASSAQTTKQLRDSIATINKLLDTHPNSVNLKLNKVSLYLQMSEWEDAINLSGDILADDEDNLSALFYRAYANNNMRRYDLAKNDYEHFLKLSPRNMEARLGLAYTYTMLGRDADALDELNMLVEMFPDSSVVYAARAEQEKTMKSYDTALFDINEAIKREPSNRDFIVTKVELLLLSGRRKDAKDTLDDAVRNGVPKGLLLEWYKKCR